MWFFIDPCRKTLVFLALQTRARRLEVSCLLGLWFVNLSARGGSSSSSCSQTSVLSWFSCSSCFHSFTRRQQQEESVFTHMQISDAKRSLHILKWRRLNNIFFSGLQKGGSQSVALLRLPGSCQCEGCQQALLSTRPQTIYRIKMVPSAFNTSAWACCSCCKCVWAFPASTVTSAPPCVSCSSWK